MSVRLLNAVATQTKAKLTPTQRLVLFVLALRHNDETGQCNPSVATIAAQAGVDGSNARKAIAALERMGLIRRVQIAKAHGPGWCYDFPGFAAAISTTEGNIPPVHTATEGNIPPVSNSTTGGNTPATGGNTPATGGILPPNSIDRKEIEEDDDDARARDRRPGRVICAPTLADVLKFAADGLRHPGGKAYPEQWAREWFTFMKAAIPPWTDRNGSPIRSWRQKMITAWRLDEKDAQREQSREGAAQNSGGRIYRGRFAPQGANKRGLD